MHRTRTASILPLLFAVLLVAPLFSARAEDAPQGQRRFSLVASTTQIADFARQIVGDDWVVHSILAPGADPHVYTPVPSDLEKVRNADLCLENGWNLEGKNWMATLAADAGKPLVTCIEGVSAIQLEEDGEPIRDPHAWFNPAYAAIYVNNIVRAVVQIDPENKAQYEARARLYLQQLRILDAWIREEVNRIPPARRLLVTSHDAFNYFTRAYRFNPENDFLSIAPVGWSTGSEVGAGITPESVRVVVASIREAGAPAIFVETSVNPGATREIAREAGVVIGGTLYSDSMGAAGTVGETYIGMMRENVLMIVTALTAPPDAPPAGNNAADESE